MVSGVAAMMLGCHWSIAGELRCACRRPPATENHPNGLPVPARCSNRQPDVQLARYEAFGGTAQALLPLQSFLPPWPCPLQAFLPAQSCVYSFDAQPPLPLQEFLPAQPLSPLLQLPWPLHALRPLQACLSTVAVFSAVMGGAVVGLVLERRRAGPARSRV